MTPIFFRDGGDVRLMAGHANFVNTSRKIHLGSDAVCALLDWEHPRADRPSVPS
ncbi:MAG: hypothetical protein IIA40_03100 [SAR324 cluster bacterium]|nr:hypothetical protein [SAR324 cluster bacterium]